MHFLAGVRSSKCLEHGTDVQAIHQAGSHL